MEIRKLPSDIEGMIEGEVSVTYLTSNKILYRCEDDGSLLFDFERLTEFNPTMAEAFVANTGEFLETFKKVVDENFKICKGFKFRNFPTEMFLIPISYLRSENLGKIVAVKGILKRLVQVSSKINSISYECSSCGTVITMLQEGSTVQAPTKCSCGGRATRFHKTKEDYENIQELELEENIDEIGARQPQKVRVLLNGPLTDPDFNKFQVGNKVEITGILNKMPQYISGKEKEKVVIDYLIKAFDITSVDVNDEDFKINDEDIKKIIEISKRRPLDYLAANIAPSISDMEDIKKSIILFLVKGVTKNFANSERRRGEIHILIVGEPGVAKSAMLQNIQKRAINCRLADGKDASKAGIVCSVVKDTITEKWALEAGDLVLCNGGYLLIDEFDKLPEEDRKAIHRPLEQGEVVVSKAGIHATLRSETSLFAVANPRMSNFSLGVPIISQIDVSPTLLSRFDLIFILKDIINEEVDRKKASEILKTHSGYVKESMNIDLFKKYIVYSRRLKPQLSPEICDRITELYSKLRLSSTVNGEKMGMPVTPRHLEGIIRLSEASAKIRLSNKVEDIDVDIAEELFATSLNQFGFDNDSRIIDLNKVTNKIKPSRRDKYYAVLEILRHMSQSQQVLKTTEIIEQIQRRLGINYGEALDMISTMHSQSEIMEAGHDAYKLTDKNF